MSEKKRSHKVNFFAALVHSWQGKQIPTRDRGRHGVCLSVCLSVCEGVGRESVFPPLLQYKEVNYGSDFKISKLISKLYFNLIFVSDFCLSLCICFAH